jgi:hypothetical protein
LLYRSLYRAPVPLACTAAHANNSNSTEIEEAADQGGISGDAPVDLVPIERLLKHVGKKVRGGLKLPHHRTRV